MKQVKKSWIALLLGALLLGTLVGVVWARPKSHHGGFHYTITIPAGEFDPAYDGLDWQNWGDYVEVESGSGGFIAQVPMLPGNRTVESMTMYVWDNHVTEDSTLGLYRLKTDGTEERMAYIYTSGSSASIRSFSDTSINPSTIWGGHGVYLYLYIGGTSINVYSVQITYY